MKNSTRTVNRIAAPVKSVTQRFAYLLLILSAIGVLVIGRVDVASMEQVRTQIVDAVAPILDVIGRPVESFNVGVDRIHEIYTVFDANQKLRQERDRLLHWQALARKLETENRALKGLLNFNAGPEPRFIAARVVADTGGAFAHSLILNAGERAGVRKGQAAVTGDGLIGRISGVGSRSSRLLLITDLNSRIPIVIESKTRDPRGACGDQCRTAAYDTFADRCHGSYWRSGCYLRSWWRFPKWPSRWSRNVGE